MAVEEFGGTLAEGPDMGLQGVGGDGGSRHFDTGSGVSPVRTENVGG